ncbi:ATP-grasp domain-containing protein [Aliikangiella sp. IMCC44359]|uniref:ATP-grasp domain-containing protein n=1 Tax=Aliikangiella sp. IMCC44359 TaxID=3459125 RepID=UPI00403A9FD3
MAHLLIIENWVEGTGRLLPKAIRELGHEYTFVTRNPAHYADKISQKTHPIFENAKHILTCETNNIDELIHFLKAQHQCLNFDGVLTICDYYIDTVAKVAQSLNLPQAFSSNVSSECQKHLVRQAIEKEGLPNPKYVIAKNWQETINGAVEIGFPLIIKPSDLASSAFVTLVNNVDELKQAFSKLEAFTHNFRDQIREPIWLLEEYLTGEEVSVEACTHQGVTTIIGITDKSLTGFPYFIEDGHMFPAKLEPEMVERIESYVIDVLNAVGHDHGISHTEVKLTPDGLRIIEINPRPGGNYIAELIQRVASIDMLSIHIDLALNQKPDLSHLNNIKGSAAIKFLVPEEIGLVKSISGVESLQSDPNVIRSDIKSLVGRQLEKPIDNACYAGHVIAVDQDGARAREFAEKALSRIQINLVNTDQINELVHDELLEGTR